jgi:beta-glucanase (GH16 family)
MATMFTMRLLPCLVLAACFLHGRLHAANLLSNPGFESDVPGQSGSLPGWQTYGANTYSLTNAAIAHSGITYFKVYQAFNGMTNLNGIYQDYASGPGATYAANGWASTGDVLAGKNLAWIEVSFRDFYGNVLALYRSAQISTNTIATGAFPKGQWNYLPVTNQYNPGTLQLMTNVTQLVAPSGTIYVRYRIVLQGDANNSNGSVYFDDLSLIPNGSAPYGNMNIVWSDEFNGTSINDNVWTYDTGNGGWGNQERECYTSRTNNAYEAGGYLHIAAQKESFGGSSYTSARVKSEGLFSLQYGRVEWRAQLPAGTAFWPALWMLGTNISSIGWPGCGEIDVMETKGTDPSMAQGSIHSGSDATTVYNFTDGGSATNFNTYTLDWTTNAVLFYVNGHLYETQTNWGSSTTNSYPFPFNQPFFLIMNMAIGGNYLGNPSTNTINSGSTFPSEMLVDYVRLYNVTGPLQLAVQRNGTNVILTWQTNIVCRLQVETNSLAAGPAGWVPAPTNTSPLQITPAHTGNAFYRLTSP